MIRYTLDNDYSRVMALLVLYQTRFHSALEIILDSVNVSSPAFTRDGDRGYFPGYLGTDMTNKGLHNKIISGNDMAGSRPFPTCIILANS